MIQRITGDNISVLAFETGKGNAFSQADMLELSDRLNDIQASDQICGLILTGSNRSFSIGGNVDAILSLKTDEERSDFFRIMDGLLIQLFSISKPVVAALNGHAIGFGFLLSLCADYVVSVHNEKIKLGMPEIKLGMGIDAVMCGVLEFNNINGKSLAKVIYSGELFNVSQALELGVIDRLVADSDLLPVSKSMASQLVQNNPVAFAANKNIIRENALQRMQRNFEDKKYNIFVEILKNRETLLKLSKR